MAQFDSYATPFIVDPQNPFFDVEGSVLVCRELYPLFDPERSRFGTPEDRQRSVQQQRALDAAIMARDFDEGERLFAEFVACQAPARDCFPAIFQLLRAGKPGSKFLRRILKQIKTDMSCANALLDTPQRAVEIGNMTANAFLVQLGLEAGADANAPDKYGITPIRHAMRLAEEEEHAEIIALLRRAGAVENV
ncbi:hypothetical protein JKP88DRAFT_255145 [Tribonema minus]|uniref:Ankyrin repeat domain-containing protein n=1 Tax=Tribonema minus TaxID=303371 RepID=A0A835Z0Y8_9STRA|nr:hypothetical protein JKP88DRAFT_255145 [Tribonema minus]